MFELYASYEFAIVVKQGPVINVVYRLSKAIITIGRDTGNDICLNDPNLSRQHARLIFSDGNYHIEDSGSTQGTYLNGEPVINRRCQLFSGDIIMLGESVVLVFRIGATREHLKETILPVTSLVNQTLSQKAMATTKDLSTTAFAKAAGAHVFISYSHQDSDYVKQLAREFEHQNFNIWFDEYIDYGASWYTTITQAIRNCDVFVVIMTPEAEQSEWVEVEIFVAKRNKKPIFPLLLRGNAFHVLITTQYADVTNGNMPPKDFYEHLSRVVSRK